jgi:decaprenyl-phosphate phosphoribosyltransferase
MLPLVHDEQVDMGVVSVDVVPPLESTGGRRSPASRTFAAFVATARPKQWTKNVLVFAAPGAAGVLMHGHALAATTGAFLLFCVVASGTYFLNDTIDADADRNHPQKRLRPIAVGALAPREGLAAGVALLMVGTSLSAVVSWRLTAVIAFYVAVQLAYSLRLKQAPIVDLACVASGFVLRAVAGGVASGVSISRWFLIVALFGALMMATGKRAAEQAQLGPGRGRHRATLDAYSEEFLQRLLLISAAVAVSAYCLWAFEKQAALGPGGDGIWYQLSIVAFAAAIVRYTLIVERGGGGQPTDVMLSDRVLQATGTVWVALFALGVYVH